MSKPRGHSNARVYETEPHPTAIHKASIPIEGGATVYTVKDLPPLALSREEWQEIGERMGWFNEPTVAAKPDPARGWWVLLTQEERDEHIKKHWPLSGPPSYLTTSTNEGKR